jgi:hypothetical protein
MRAIDVPVLDRIVMNVVNVPAEIIVVAYDVGAPSLRQQGWGIDHTE